MALPPSSNEARRWTGAALDDHAVEAGLLAPARQAYNPYRSLSSTTENSRGAGYKTNAEAHGLALVGEPAEPAVARGEVVAHLGAYDAFGVFRAARPQKIDVSHATARNEVRLSPNTSCCKSEVVAHRAGGEGCHEMEQYCYHI